MSEKELTQQEIAAVVHYACKQVSALSRLSRIAAWLEKRQKRNGQATQC